MMDQKALCMTSFPLGNMTKAQVRELAAEHGLDNADKEESQDICFVDKGDYADYIEAYTGKTFPAGDITDTEGKILGRHRGLIRYTLGQRRGGNTDAGSWLRMYRCHDEAYRRRTYCAAFAAHGQNKVSPKRTMGPGRTNRAGFNPH
jgi:tRNA U34 2-thiouridine synthase MnmA/TrmU